MATMKDNGLREGDDSNPFPRNAMQHCLTQ